MPNEPLDLFFERLVAGEPISRRAALRRMGAAGPASSARRARCWRPAAASRAPTRTTTATAGRRTASHPKTAIGDRHVQQLAAVHRQRPDKDLRPRLGEGDRRPMKYIEDYNDNEEFFAKVRQELEARPPDRPRARRADRLDGRALDRPRLRRADRQGATSPTPRTSQDSLASPPYDPERNFTLPWQSGITGHRLQPEEDRQPADAASTTSSTRSSRAA